MSEHFAGNVGGDGIPGGREERCTTEAEIGRSHVRVRKDERVGAVSSETERGGVKRQDRRLYDDTARGVEIGVVSLVAVAGRDGL